MIWRKAWSGQSHISVKFCDDSLGAVWGVLLHGDDAFLLVVRNQRIMGEEEEFFNFCLGEKETVEGIVMFLGVNRSG